MKGLGRRGVNASPICPDSVEASPRWNRGASPLRLAQYGIFIWRFAICYCGKLGLTRSDLCRAR